MVILTDNPEYSSQILNSRLSYKSVDTPALEKNITFLLERLFEDKKVYKTVLPDSFIFKYILIKEFVSFSQYDLLIEYAKKRDKVPEGIACLAGPGENFHGFRSRHWIALPGNIHLSILLQPDRVINDANAAFLMLATTAVVKTISGLSGLKRGSEIQWVNDIMLGGLKVGGVLAHSQVCGNVIESVALGIGLNVEQNPNIKNDRILKGTTTINEWAENGESCKIVDILTVLLENLQKSLIYFFQQITR